MPSRTLEEELVSLLGSDRSSSIAARYFGLDGRGGTSLQKVGEEVGLTRERVRQILMAIQVRLCEGPIEAPVLNRVINFISENLPSPAHEIEASLQRKGLTLGRFRTEKLIALAEFLRKPPSFMVVNSGGRLVIPGSKQKHLNASINLARSLSHRWGMTNADQLVKGLRKRYGGSDWHWVHRVFPSHPDFRWLDQSAGWFWFFDISRNQVAKRIYKILSVGCILSLDDLGHAVRRELRMREFRPPKSVFRELCRQLPHLVLEGDLVSASRHFRPQRLLNRCEQIIVSVLRKHGGVLPRQDLFQVCAKAGMNPRTINQHLVYSPVIIRLGTNIYGLVGASLDSARSRA
jgi:hypothetical protein